MSPASILNKSIAGRYRPVSYTDGPITVRYRFIKKCLLGAIRVQAIEVLLHQEL